MACPPSSVLRPPSSFRFTPNQVLALVCLPIFIGALDLTIISAVLPPILSDLQIPYQKGMDDAAWMVSGYLLAYTVSMTFMGRVSDIWGRKRILLLCLAIFILGSAFVAAAPGAPADWAFDLARRAGLRPDRAFVALYTLIFGRVVQAFGAGALVPVGMALASDLFPPGRRSLALGVIGGVDTAGWVLGHLYGGVMVQYFPWPVLFWINIPLAGGALLLTFWALRDFPPPSERPTFDWPGAVLISLALAAINLALNTGVDLTASPNAAGQAALQAARTVSLPWLAVTFANLLLFWAWELRRRDPLIHLANFRARNFSLAGFINLLIGFCIMAGLVSVPLYINTVPVILYGIDQIQAALISGVLLSAFTIPMALASLVGGWLTSRWGIRWTTSLGAALAAIGFYAVSFWRVDQCQPVVALFQSGPAAMDWSQWVGVFKMLWGLKLAGIGIGLTISPIATAVINAAPSQEHGVASALVIIMRLVGMTLGISALTNFGIQRTKDLLTLGLQEVPLTDFARQLQALVEATTRVINEMNGIAALVCLVAALAALTLQSRENIKGC